MKSFSMQMSRPFLPYLRCGHRAKFSMGDGRNTILVPDWPVWPSSILSIYMIYQLQYGKQSRPRSFPCWGLNLEPYACKACDVPLSYGHSPLLLYLSCRIVSQSGFVGPFPTITEMVIWAGCDHTFEQSNTLRGMWKITAPHLSSVSAQILLVSKQVDSHFHPTDRASMSRLQWMLKKKKSQ